MSLVLNNRKSEMRFALGILLDFLVGDCILVLKEATHRSKSCKKDDIMPCFLKVNLVTPSFVGLLIQSDTGYLLTAKKEGK